MAQLAVLTFPDSRLREPNAPVTVFDEALQKLSEDMFETMYAHDGIGLAAPQVNVHLNLVVIDIPADGEDAGSGGQLVLCNPLITALAGEQVLSEEGCLSVPEYRDKVPRRSICSVRYQDLSGAPKELNEVGGMLAICLQHEIDHLSGKLFVDYISRLKRQRLSAKLKKREALAREQHD